MKIIVRKLTDESLAQEACAFTTGKEQSSISLYRLYPAMHSTVRTQLFWIKMYDIPTFVSVHIVRHAPGINHYVKSNREDLPGFTGDLGRMQPVNHAMLLNAEALINIAHKRLCNKAHELTRAVVEEIRKQIFLIDPTLGQLMVPMCEYRNGLCSELKPCGRKGVK